MWRQCDIELNAKTEYGRDEEAVGSEIDIDHSYYPVPTRMKGRQPANAWADVRYIVRESF